jgi:DNA-binding beta-propeller fold protein YncE
MLRGLRCVIVSFLPISCLLAGGCTTNHLPPRAQQAGSLAVDPKTGTLWVADTFNGGVALVAPEATVGNIGVIATGKRPERIVLRGNNAFVANRFSRTISQIDVATRRVVRQLATDAEPMGMDVSDDGTTLYVACAMGNSVDAFDTSSGVRLWSASVGEEVRAVAWLGDGRLYAPSYKTGKMHVLGARTGEALGTFSFQTSFLPTGVEHALVAPGNVVFLSYSLSNTTFLGTVIDRYYVNPESFSVLPAFLALDTTKDGVAAEQQALFPREVPANSPYSLSPPAAGYGWFSPFAGPKVSILDSTGNLLLTLNYLSANLSVQGATAPFLPSLVSVGNGPDGIAVSNDGTTV